MTATILQGDCRERMAEMDAETIDAIVCDPPYELNFMGHSWDRSGVAFDADTWRAAYRVLKPGGHLLAFGGSRTFHRIAVAIEDAGFEIRDTLSWLYGSGFPKSLDVSKAIDRAAGATRETSGRRTDGRYANPMPVSGRSGGIKGDVVERLAPEITAPATPEAEQWAGWGTALKPAWEPVIMARKPLAKGHTVAGNVLAHGTGALNIDACRIGTKPGDYDHPGNTGIEDKRNVYGSYAHGNQMPPHTAGRWPPNVALDEEAAAMLDAQSGERPSKRGPSGLIHNTGDDGNIQFTSRTPRISRGFPGDTGGASRFMYVAKASRRERNAGLDGMPERVSIKLDQRRAEYREDRQTEPIPVANHHPTVKPIALMRWLVRMITPPAGTVLDCFAGSGTTGIAAVLEGFNFIGCEMEAEYIEIAQRRIAYWQTHKEDADALPRQESFI